MKLKPETYFLDVSSLYPYCMTQDKLPCKFIAYKNIKNIKLTQAQIV
jgi:hypothetical protein